MLTRSQILNAAQRQAWRARKSMETRCSPHRRGASSKIRAGMRGQAEGYRAQHHWAASKQLSTHLFLSIREQDEVHPILVLQHLPLQQGRGAKQVQTSRQIVARACAPALASTVAAQASAEHFRRLPGHFEAQPQ